MTLCPRHPRRLKIAAAPSRGWCPSCLVDMGKVRALPERVTISTYRGGIDLWPNGAHAAMLAFRDRAHRRDQTVPWGHDSIRARHAGRYCQCAEEVCQLCQSCREAARWRGDEIAESWERVWSRIDATRPGVVFTPPSVRFR